VRKYKIHIMIFAALIGLSVASLILGCCSGVMQKEQQFRFLSSLPYDYCYEFSGDDYVSNSYINLNEAYSAKAGGKTIKSDKLMQLDSAQAGGIWENIPMLKSDEIYVSANLMNAHKLNVGDELLVQSPTSPEARVYRIVGELAPCYGLYQNFTDINRGIILFGYDEAFLADNSASFITYQGKDFRPSETTSQLVSLSSIKEQAEAVGAELLQVVAIMWCILLVADVIVSYYMFAMRHRYLQKLYHAGLGGIQVLAKVCTQVMSPLILCRAMMLLCGFVFLAVTGCSTWLLISIGEALLITVITLIHKKLIERSV